MKNLTNILLILIVVLVLGFSVIIILNIFTAPKQHIPAVTKPTEETAIPEPKTTAQPKTETTETLSIPAAEPKAETPQVDLSKPTKDQELKAKIDSLIAKMTSNNVEEALKAEDELVSLGKPALKALVNVLSDLEPSEDILRPEIAFILGRFEDKEAVPALITLLENENSYIRRNAIDSLGRIRSQEAALALTAKLSDEDNSVREAAAYALGEIRGFAATDDLRNKLKDENEEETVKLAIVQTLAKIKDNRSTEDLLAQLKTDSTPFYKDEVVDSLANLGDAKAVSGLNEYLEQLKNNKPEDTGDLSSWQMSLEITEQAIQSLAKQF